MATLGNKKQRNIRKAINIEIRVNFIKDILREMDLTEKQHNELLFELNDIIKSAQGFEF